MKKVSILFIVMIIIMCGCNKKEKINIKTKEDLSIEINSKTNISSLIDNIDEINVVNGEDLIDTSKLGEKEIILKYYDKNKKENYYSFKVNIVDTTLPIIECKESIDVVIGKEIDLLKNVKVTDNSNEKINPTVEGEYDYNKIGKYNLKYIATDSSGNKAEKVFTLNVIGYKLNNTGYYVFKDKDAWLGLKFEKNGKISWLPWWCPGFACGGGGVMFGKYVINGNNITATFTETYSDTGEKTKINEVIKYKLISDNTIVDDKNSKYNWQKNFN